jgi:hypothetical protein
VRGSGCNSLGLLGGSHPALVLETSPGHFQAWLKQHEALDQESSTAVARFLAGMFDGDIKSADWRHFGRLAGFTNRKPQYQSASTGLYPYVRLLGAEGAVYPRSEELIAEVRHDMDVRFEHRMEVKKQAIAAILTRDPAHKGSRRQQEAYARHTVEKALLNVRNRMTPFGRLL